MGRGGIENVIECLTTHLPAMFNHPYKNIEDCDMLSFLCAVYLEFWNSSDPCEEYIPDFTNASSFVQDECADMITETVYLLKHIRSCQFLPSMNKVKKNG